MKYYILTFLMTILLAGCASSGQTSGSGGQASTSEVKVDNPSISLEDYLKRVPGISVSGSGSNIQIRVRGTISQHGNPSPLFVVDGNRYGRDFSRAKSAVPVNMIDSIRVLKGVEASSQYGEEGGAGVIVITTKRN